VEDETATFTNATVVLGAMMEFSLSARGLMKDGVGVSKRAFERYSSLSVEQCK
jgi:hypothetical protein